MSRGLVIVLCMLCACLRDPKFNGYEGVQLVIIEGRIDTDPMGGVQVSGPSYQVHFSTSGAHYPDDFRVRNMRDDLTNILAAGAPICSDEQASGMAVYPMPHANTLLPPNTQPPTVPIGGGAAAQVALQWSEANACGVMATGTTSYTFHLDDRIVRHDDMTVMTMGSVAASGCGCDASNLGWWVFASYMNLDMDVLSAVKDGIVADVVIGTGFGDEAMTHTGNQICAEGFQGMRFVAGYEQRPRIRRTEPDMTPGSKGALALIHEYLPTMLRMGSISGPLHYQSNTTYLLDKQSTNCNLLYDRLAEVSSGADSLSASFDGGMSPMGIDPATGMYTGDFKVQGDKVELTLGATGAIHGPFVVTVQFEGARSEFRVFNENRGTTPLGQITRADTGQFVVVYFEEDMMPGQKITIVGDR